MFIRQLYNEIRSKNLIISNFPKIVNICASQQARLIIRIAFFCSKLIKGSDSDPMQYKHMKNGNEK